MSGWTWLIIAIGFEASWVAALRYTEGWTRLLPSVFVVVVYGLGLIPLSFASRSMSASVLYAVWVGGGIVAVSLFDTLYVREPMSLLKLVCIVLILTGAVGLKVITPAHS